MTNIQAINLLKGLEQSLDDYCELNDEGKTAFGMAITALELFGNSEQLPSAQPEKRTEERMETHACDLIDREAAVDAIYHHLPSVSRTRARTMLHEVPSAQPDIIRCRNCKFASGDSRICMKFDHSPIGELDFCAWAERRTDE